MRKLGIIFLASVLFLGMSIMAPPVTAQTPTPTPTPTATPLPDTPIYVQPFNQTVPPGGQFTVDIRIEPVTATSAFQFDLSFDPALLTADNVACGDFLPSPPHMFNPGTINNTTGIIDEVWGVHIGSGGVSDPGAFAQITFTAKHTTGSSPLHLYGVTVADPDGLPLPVYVTDGTVTVGTPTMTPTMTPTPTPTPTPTGTPPGQYTLNTGSTGGGGVTTPGEGSFPRPADSATDLLAVAEPGCCFVKWTGDTGTIADVWAPGTTITMNDDYSVVANFTGQATIWDVFGVITAYSNMETSIWNVFRLIGCYAG